MAACHHTHHRQTSQQHRVGFRFGHERATNLPLWEHFCMDIGVGRSVIQSGYQRVECMRGGPTKTRMNCGL